LSLIHPLRKPLPRALLDGRESYTFTPVRNDAAVLVAESVAVEATQAPASAAERAALVEKAAGFIVAAAKAGCADYMGRPASVIADWRNRNPAPKGKAEAAMVTALAGVLSALAAAKAAALSGRTR
jgi:hypothetical protein